MTTIASDMVRLACDSSVSDDDQVWYTAKAERINGGVYATSGSASEGERFYAWIRRNRRGKRPEVTEGFQALALTSHGLFFYDHMLEPMRMIKPMAIGSGAKAARAALAAGAGLEQAVKIACEIDANSRPPVQIYSLEGSDQ